jgi:hypothetical protein
MDAVGLALIGTFVLMMIASVFALSFQAPQGANDCIALCQAQSLVRH